MKFIRIEIKKMSTNTDENNKDYHKFQAKGKKRENNEQYTVKMFRECSKYPMATSL